MKTADAIDIHAHFSPELVLSLMVTKRLGLSKRDQTRILHGTAAKLLRLT